MVEGGDGGTGRGGFVEVGWRTVWVTLYNIITAGYDDGVPGGEMNYPPWWFVVRVETAQVITVWAPDAGEEGGFEMQV